MVDLSLMRQLLDAVPPRARLVLLGDRDQLASVEAGAVLADLCGDAPGDARGAGLAGCVVELTHGHRYASGSGIDRLARAIRAGDAQAALAVLADERHDDVSLCAGSGRGLGDTLRAHVQAGYAPLFEARGAGQRLRALEGFRVLCAHQVGPSGAAELNRAIEAARRRAGRVDARAARYAGQPLGILRNDYALELYNGDVGVLDHPPGEEGSGAGELLAAFAGPQGQLRWIAPACLPAHELVYAATVHRSQGAEYREVALALGDVDSALLSRELLYTAVTRARERVRIYARPVLVARAVARRVERASGLRGRLWGAAGAAGRVP
jgi:exodeoxyribonuclease V alpha subunit